jgi:molecular chaperone DnaJ
VEPHDFFRRNNTDVICSVQISFIQAALGASIKVPTLEGEIDFDIPKGTQPGETFRLMGRGIPSLRHRGRGDQVIQVDVKTPTHLSKKQEELLRQFASLEENKFSKRLKNMLKGNASRAAL